MWLGTLPLPDKMPVGLPDRVRALAAAGLEPFDALHLAWAEALRADALVTTDDRFIRRGTRAATAVRLLSPLASVQELTR